MPDASAVETLDEDAGPSERGPVDIGLVVQYHALNVQPRDGVVSPALKIVNRASEQSIPLCALELRYYFTNEHAELCPQDCTIDTFYSGLQPSGEATAANRSYHAAANSDGDAYLQITFPCGGGAVALALALAKGESVETQQQFHTTQYRELDEADDYSYRPSPSAFADWDHVTLYRDGVLVWGTAPP